MENQTNEKQPILVVYNDGSYEMARIPNGAFRNILRQLGAEADNQMMLGTMPQATPPEMAEDTDDTA